jgi:YjbE family integral membrane protein
MKELLQIILINLVVSCDNVGVIALSTCKLPHDKAVKARRMGIGLSVALKVLFIIVVGFLLSVSWLHIRIIGGVLLIYVTFNMLKQNSRDSLNQEKKTGCTEDSFLLAIISIVAADVSMSLDNVVAVLGVVTSDGQGVGLHEFILVFLGLLLCVPVLLFFSETVSYLMEKYKVLSCFCAGYLIYTAVKMIFEDEIIKLFFEEIHFSFALPAAILCGVLMGIYGILSEVGILEERQERRYVLLPVYCVIVIYSLVTVGVISYLSTDPFMDGFMLNVELAYGFLPTGVNAVYTIGTSSSLLTISAVILSAIVAKECKKKSYRAMFFANIKGMAIFVLLELTVCTAGLAFTFGPGSMNPGRYLGLILIQLLLLLTYSATFCMLSVYITGRTMLITVGMLYVFLESSGAALFAEHGNWGFIAEFFPSYHIATISGHMSESGSLLYVCIMALLYIVLVTVIGMKYYQLQTDPIQANQLQQSNKGKNGLYFHKSE